MACACQQDGSVATAREGDAGNLVVLDDHARASNERQAGCARPVSVVRSNQPESDVALHVPTAPVSAKPRDSKFDLPLGQLSDLLSSDTCDRANLGRNVA